MERQVESSSGNLTESRFFCGGYADIGAGVSLYRLENDLYFRCRVEGRVANINERLFQLRRSEVSTWKTAFVPKRDSTPHVRVETNALYNRQRNTRDRRMSHWRARVVVDDQKFRGCAAGFRRKELGAAQPRRVFRAYACAYTHVRANSRFIGTWSPGTRAEVRAANSNGERPVEGDGEWTRMDNRRESCSVLLSPPFSVVHQGRRLFFLRV